MSTTRRGAFRLNLGAPGILYFNDHEAKCVVVDISATGARVRLLPPVLLPDRFTLETTIVGETIEMDAQMIRGDPYSEIAMVFDNPEHRRLHQLLHQEQRRIIASGVKATVEGQWSGSDSEAEAQSG